MSDLKSNLTTRDWDTYDIAEDAKVDKYNLDIDAELQSSLVAKWQELSVEANDRLTKAKEALNYVESKLTLQARADGVPGVDKITDAVVKAWVNTQDEYRVSLKRKIKAESDVSMINAALKALDHKKEMIKVEAHLWITGYYSKPKIKASVSIEQQEHRKNLVSEELEKSLRGRERRKAEE